MIRPLALLTACAVLSACSFGGPVSTYPAYQPTPGQGQYVRPEWLNPRPPPRVPQRDVCRARLYAGLVGQHEGAIFLPGLPGRKRVIKPAELEGFGYDRDDALYVEPPYVEVREFLAGQTLYAPGSANIADRLNLGPEIPERLTIELDSEGYVRELSCR